LTLNAQKKSNCIWNDFDAVRQLSLYPLNLPSTVGQATTPFSAVTEMTGFWVAWMPTGCLVDQATTSWTEASAATGWRAAQAMTRLRVAPATMRSLVAWAMTGWSEA